MQGPQGPSGRKGFPGDPGPAVSVLSPSRFKGVTLLTHLLGSTRKKRFPGQRRGTREGCKFLFLLWSLHAVCAPEVAMLLSWGLGREGVTTHTHLTHIKDDLYRVV